MVFQFGREVQIPDVARNLELLLASGNAYSSFTVGGNTRKYHGLFVRNGRLLLAGFDEMVNGIRFSSQHYAGSSNTHGLRYLHAFSAYPPAWIYMIDDIIIQKTITFDGDLSVTYDIAGDADLWIRPLITDRSVHEVVKDPHPGYRDDRNGVRWGDLYLEADLSYTPNPETYRDVWYQQEYERGYEAAEDLHSPGVFQGRVQDSTFTFRCTGDTPAVQNIPRKKVPQTSIDWLEWASSAFCNGDEIVAGYHWFCESWGRDSAISVTGLIIERGVKSEARR